MSIKSKFQYAQQLLRRTGLLTSVEYLDYLLSVLRLTRKNASFVRDNPGFVLPPRHLAYDAYSAPDWHFYKESGEESALYLKDMALEYLGAPPGRVLEWGCGPGRIIRHLPAVLGAGNSVYGCDYNSETIRWCQKSLAGIDFSVNQLNPPLAFPSDQFDLVYAISVFTHLSEATGLNWIEELYRVLKPGGILLVTLKGDSYYDRLLPAEKAAYDSVGIVARGNVTEGRKMYATFHNPSYVREKLLTRFRILNHIPFESPLSAQDTWIAGKPR